jgi:hypothetical protein
MTSKQSYLAVTSIWVAIFATAAATTQSFLAWNARHDQFKSAVFAQGVTRCGEAISMSNEYVSAAMSVTVVVGSDEDYRKFLDAGGKLGVALETLQLLAGPIAPEFSESLEQARTQIQSHFDRIGSWRSNGTGLGKIGASINETTNTIRKACKQFVHNAVFK